MWEQGDQGRGALLGQAKDADEDDSVNNRQLIITAHLLRARLHRLCDFAYSVRTAWPASVISRVCGTSRSPFLHL